MADAKGIKMGQGYVSLGVDRGPLDAGLEAAKSTFQAWGKGIAALGAAIAAGGAMVTAPFLGGMGDFAAWGSAMRTTMRESGMGFNETRLAMNGFGLSAEELPNTAAKLAEFMMSAASGSREANAALADMGINLADLQAASQGEQLLMVADGLNRIGDAGTRLARQRDVFGRSGLAMNISGGREGVQSRAARRDFLQGDSYSEEAQRIASAYARAKGELGTASSAIWQSLAMAAAPVMTELYQKILLVVVTVREWIDANRPLLAQVFQWASYAVAAGAAIGFVGSAVYAASYAFTFLSGAIGIVAGVLSFVGGPVVALVNFGLAALGGMLAFAANGFGLLTIASAAYAVGQVVSSAIINTAMLAYSFFTAAATASTYSYVASLVVAWVWENLCSAGLWLITSAAVAATIALGAVAIAAGGFVLLVGGFSLAVGAIVAMSYAVSSLGIEFAELHESLSFLDGIHELAVNATEAFYDMWAAIANSAIGSFFSGISSAIMFIWDTATDAFNYVYEAMDAIGAIDFLQTLVMWGVGIAGMVAGMAAFAAYGAYIVTLEIWDTLKELFSGPGMQGGMFGGGEGGGASILLSLFTKIGELARSIFTTLTEWMTPIANFGRYLTAVITNTFANVFEVIDFTRIIASFGFITTAAGEIFDSIGDAFTTSFGVIADFFTQIVDTAMLSFAGVKAAFSAGEWELLWGILQTTALLAWEHISFMGLSIFYVWKDTMIDAFSTAWNAIKSMFIVVWGEIKAMAFEGIAAMLRGLAAVAPNEAMARVLRAQGEGFGLEARLARGNAARDAANVGNSPEELAAWFDEQATRVDRDMALAAGNAAEVARLNAELQDQVWYAQFLESAMAGAAAAAPGGAGGGMGGALAAATGSSTGTFSRYAAAGFLGATTGAGESRHEREARLARQNLDELVRIAARQRGVVMR